jgi:NAD+ diphosphatase
MGETLFAVAGRAIQIIAWDRDHQFCSRCGAKTAAMAMERAKQCPECKLVTYPRLSPAIIVRVRRGDEMLLARNANWPQGRYSILAGFVEPGETLEETVEREVMEEVGLRVKNIKYFASQPWPFPNSLMLGFTADYDSGEITFNDQEIATADWFRADNLPQIPPPGSISRVLIDDFVAAYHQNVGQAFDLSELKQD